MQTKQHRLWRKALSLVLTVLMVGGYVGLFSGLIGNDPFGTKQTADAADATVYFYVPEAVYLKQGSYGTQWYLNSYRSNSTQSWASAKETTGKLFFYCPGATSVSISTSGGTVSNLTTTGTDTINDTDFQISGSGGNVITYTATYKVNGETKTATSYTYLYEPNRVPTGVATEAESEKYSWSSYTYYGFISVLWGAQSYDQRANNGGTDGACYAESGNIYLGNKGLNAGSGNQRPHNTNMLEYGTGTFGYHNNDNKTTSMTSPTCYFYVDGSRYSNLNQIPNFYYGLTLTDDENTYGGSDAHCLLYSFVADGHTSGASEPSALTGRYVDWEGDGERVLKQEGDCAPSYAFSVGAGSTHNYTLYTYGRGWGKKDTWSHHHIHFQLINNYKGDLRNLYLSELSKSYNRQSSFYSSGWDAYVSAMKNAATVLGNPYVSYSTVTSAINTLNSAISGLVAKKPTITRGTWVRNGAEGYYVYVQVDRNGGAEIKRVQFPTWTNLNGQDDIQSSWTSNSAASGTAGSYTVSGQTYNYRYYVKVSDHNNEYVGYNTHVYAYNNLEANVCQYTMSMNFTYPVTYAGNGNTGGSTSAQTMNYGENTAISNNGFTRAYTISYNGNGGTAAKTSDTETWTFNGWNPTTSTQGYLINDVTERSGTGGSSGYTDFASWSVAAPFAAAEEYTLEFDAYGSGTLINYFYGANGQYTSSNTNGYWPIAKAVSSNGRTSTGGDGNITATMTGSWVHYKIVWTLAGTGNANTVKYVLFRASQGTSNVIHVKNVKFYQTKFVNGSYMKNQSTSGAVTMTAQWTAGSVTMPNATRSGWTLVGWNTSNSATTSAYNYNTAQTFGAAKTLYAIWKRDITNTYHWYKADCATDATKTASGTAYNAATTLALTSPNTTDVVTSLSKNDKTWTLKGWAEQSSPTWGGQSQTAAVGFNASHNVATTSSAHTFMPVYSHDTTKFYANFNYYVDDATAYSKMKMDKTVGGDATTGAMPVAPVTADGANGSIKRTYSKDGRIYELQGWTKTSGGTTVEIAYNDSTVTLTVPGGVNHVPQTADTPNMTPIELYPIYNHIGTTIYARFNYYDASGNLTYKTVSGLASGTSTSGTVTFPDASLVNTSYTKDGVTYTLKGWNAANNSEACDPFNTDVTLDVLANPATDYYTYYPVYECTTTVRYYTYTAVGAVTSSTKSTTLRKTDTFTPTTADVDIPTSGFNKTITLNGRTFTFCGWRTDTQTDVAATVAADVSSQNHAIKDAEYVYYAIYSSADLALSYDTAHDGITAAPAPATQKQTQYISVATGAADINNVAELTFDINPDNTVPEKQGYTFIGWGDTDSEDETFDYAKTGATLQTRVDKSLFARFSVNNQNVTFVYYDGASLEGDYKHETKQVSYDDLKRDDTGSNQRYVVTAPTVKLVPRDAQGNPIVNMDSIVHANDKYHYVFREWVRSDASEGKGVYTVTESGNNYTATFKNVQDDITIQGVYDAYSHHYELLTTAQLAENGVTADATAKKDATCTTDGYQYMKCVDCGHVYKQIIPKIDHKDANGNPVVTYSGYKAATCTGTGKYATAACALCGDIVKKADNTSVQYYDIADGRFVPVDSADGVIPAKGHQYQFSRTVAPTCTEKGYDLYVCANNETHTEKRNLTDALGHDPVTQAGYAATCTADGRADKIICNRCNLILSDSYVIPALGHEMEQTAAKAATCTEEGNIAYYTCRNCEKVFADKDGATEIALADTVTDALGHDWVDTPAEEATCTKDGHTAGTVCSRCGELAEGSTAITTQEALGHDWDEGVHTDSEQPCVTPGYTTYTCQRAGCGETEIEYDDLADHVEKTVAEQPATCTEKGKSSYKVCENCGKVLTNYKWLPMKAHTYTQTVTAEVPATCTTAGTSAVMKCANCDATVGGDEIPALEHSYSNWIVTAASCEADGSRTKYCKRCGDTQSEPIPAAGHTEKAVEAVAATCSAEGTTAGTVCEVCGKVLDGCEVIPMTAHDMGAEQTEREATCAQVGLVYTECAICGHKEYTTVDKLDHTGTVTKEAKAATCTATGLTEEITCSACHQVIQKQVSVPKLDHVWQTMPAVAPTCTEKGKTSYEKCVNCDLLLTEARDVPALGHQWGEWKLVKAASCTENGSRVRYCTVKSCAAHTAVIDEAAQTKVLELLGHSMTYVPEKAASCGVEGNKPYYVCSRCEGVYYKDVKGLERYENEAAVKLSALEHDWNLTGVVEPTCTEKGHSIMTCAFCGETKNTDETDALGHTGGRATCKDKAVCTRCGLPYGGYEAHSFVTETTHGSCTERSVTTKYCTVCGYVASTTQGDYGPHTLDEDSLVVIREPSCTESGEYHFTCTECGETSVYTLDAMGHIDEDGDGKCDVCGQSMNPQTEDPGNGTTTGTCEKCGRNHVGKVGGFWGYDGFICKLIAFFRQIARLFSK